MPPAAVFDCQQLGIHMNFFKRKQVPVGDTISVAQPVRRIARRRSWFFYGFVIGILVMLVFNTSPDKVVQNFHSWVNLFTTATPVPTPAPVSPPETKP
jgi:hypothetical protein